MRAELAQRGSFFASVYTLMVPADHAGTSPSPNDAYLH
jgi:hypothetical protein